MNPTTQKTAATTKAELKAMIGELYGAAEMFWRERMGGSEAQRILKDAARLIGKPYVPSEYEKEHFYGTPETHHPNPTP